MKPSKILIYILIYSVLIYGCIWTFNHINPWIAILATFSVGYVSLIIIEKIYKK